MYQFVPFLSSLSSNLGREATISDTPYGEGGLPQLHEGYVIWGRWEGSDVTSDREGVLLHHPGVVHIPSQRSYNPAVRDGEFRGSWGYRVRGG